MSVKKKVVFKKQPEQVEEKKAASVSVPKKVEMVEIEVIETVVIDANNSVNRRVKKMVPKGV